MLLPGQIARVTGLVALLGGAFLLLAIGRIGGLGVCFGGPFSFKLAELGVYCRGRLRGIRDEPWAFSPVPMKKSHQLPSTSLGPSWSLSQIEALSSPIQSLLVGIGVQISTRIRLDAVDAVSY